jgi:hypothetical protein
VILVAHRNSVGYSPAMADADPTPGTTPTGRIAVHPGEMIPGIPRFLFAVPEGWVIDEAPGMLCVVRQPVADDQGFWVNAIVRHDSVARSIDFERAAKITWVKLLRSNPDATDNGERIARFGDNVVYLRGVNLDGPNGRPLAQIQSLFFAPVTEGGKLVDMFQIVGTSQRDETVQANMNAFIEMISSFRFV